MCPPPACLRDDLSAVGDRLVLDADEDGGVGRAEIAAGAGDARRAKSRRCERPEERINILVVDDGEDQFHEDKTLRYDAVATSTACR